MHHLNAFFHSMPQGPSQSPTLLNRVGNALLIPTIILTRGNVVSYEKKEGSKGYSISKIEKDILNKDGKALSITFSTYLICLIFFIPTFLFGACLKALSFIDKEVRDQHSALANHLKPHSKKERFVQICKANGISVVII